MQKFKSYCDGIITWQTKILSFFNPVHRGRKEWKDSMILCSFQLSTKEVFAPSRSYQKEGISQGRRAGQPSPTFSENLIYSRKKAVVLIILWLRTTAFLILSILGIFACVILSHRVAIKCQFSFNRKRIAPSLTTKKKQIFVVWSILSSACGFGRRSWRLGLNIT